VRFKLEIGVHGRQAAELVVPAGDLSLRVRDADNGRILRTILLTDLLPELADLALSGEVTMELPRRRAPPVRPPRPRAQRWTPPDEEPTVTDEPEVTEAFESFISDPHAEPEILAASERYTEPEILSATEERPTWDHDGERPSWDLDEELPTLDQDEEHPTSTIEEDEPPPTESGENHGLQASLAEAIDTLRRERIEYVHAAWQREPAAQRQSMQDEPTFALEVDPFTADLSLSDPVAFAYHKIEGDDLTLPLPEEEEPLPAPTSRSFRVAHGTAFYH